MVYIVYIIKILRNTLFKKDNEFFHPKLTLRIVHVLEAGTCSVKWMRDLHHKNKHKLISNLRMNINAAYVDNLSKQKVSHVRALFDKNLTTALENEHGEKEKGTWILLRTINDYVMKPLLTISTSKSLKIKESTIFTSPADIRLKCFREISSWLTFDWFPSIKKLPINKNAPHDQNTTYKTTAEYAETFESIV